jgi:hypothetical protein
MSLHAVFVGGTNMRTTAAYRLMIFLKGGCKRDHRQNKKLAHVPVQTWRE